ncbi:hypothetical protein NH8B_1938 [Pseudogulbenkiania sp. NH8B]|uniref:hypothetical protein n=1 Tax=Pseudogulbenkiania sp. (strain NH8B) TaxID=748280 RepID=UPI0002279FDF|nr:hypothetical protein [Pseudogulbenkiania sp. NH8B]BAK76753.1 hypothetical protein NH8B_1938 [Pseudogulbenkiania sp. NH8B]
MSLYITLIRRVISDTKATLDAIDQRREDYARLESLTAALRALPGIRATAHTDRHGGYLEIIASGDWDVIGRAIEATGHQIAHLGMRRVSSILPPASAGEFAMAFTLRIDQ